MQKVLQKSPTFNSSTTMNEYDTVKKTKSAKRIYY